MCNFAIRNNDYINGKISKIVYMESNKIREAFLEFFRSKQHTIVPSAPMVV